jgi:putative IMPACT (imprinted ancient) family translation regulator
MRLEPDVKVTRVVAAKHTVERSRFFAVLFPAAALGDVEAVVRRQKGELRKANHHCWAVLASDEQGRVVEKSKDDGEVGHPGRVLLEILRKYDLEGGLLVSRVFGGVKLGVGGVSRAFREAGEMAVEAYLETAGAPGAGAGARAPGSRVGKP